MKTTLIIMAAGIGSRFGGGIKQLAKMGPNGEIIMDYSIYDAKKAGFDKVVFIIRKDIEEEFKEVIGNRISKLSDAYSIVSKRIGSANADILFYENPKRILNDMDILNIEVVKKKKRFSFFRR